ncbi:YtxH domain-containing protein [Heyndrickxia vini]|uniref:YtxH domain-containing protein n=1 Tax=Heyndrickxia vini TaxID=1476025 RepID=A0ABX7DZB2_9BACI|nr:YtxH domain-containing protein [Heyndrickxia vini]QQZ08294.1 YtxH domain-containing protein [Heyndrickxia vini]
MNKKMFAYGIIVGGIAGTLSALLTTPTSGKELRKQLSDSKNDWMSSAKDITKNVHELKNSIHVLSSEGKDIAIKFVSDIKSAISDWQNNIEENKESIFHEVQALKDSIEELESKIQERPSSR